MASGSKTEISKKKKVTWTTKQEETLINEWSKYECLYKSSSSDYKRQDRRAAAREAIKVALQDVDDGTFSGPHTDMVSLYVGKTAGEVLEKYNFTTRAIVFIHLEFQINLELYLIPLVIIIGICFILMALFLVIKYWRTRLQERRSRLTPANLKKIPTKKFKDGDEYDLCAICLEDYKAGDKLRILPCEHAYHTKCVDPWLTNGKKTCPVCKQPVEKDKLNRNEHVVSVTDANERTPLLSGISDTTGEQPSTSQEAVEQENTEIPIV